MKARDIIARLISGFLLLIIQGLLDHYEFPFSNIDWRIYMILTTIGTILIIYSILTFFNRRGAWKIIKELHRLKDLDKMKEVNSKDKRELQRLKNKYHDWLFDNEKSEKPEVKADAIIEILESNGYFLGIPEVWERVWNEELMASDSILQAKSPCRNRWLRAIEYFTCRSKKKIREFNFKAIQDKN